MVLEPELARPRRGRGRTVRVVSAFAVLATADVANAVTVSLTAYALGGATWAGVAMGLVYVPGALLAPFVPRIGANLPRGTKLSLAYAAAAAVAVVLSVLYAVSAPLAAVIAVAALLGSCLSVARATHYATVPQIVLSPASLVRANSAAAFSAGAGGFVGPAIAGVLAAMGRTPLVPALSAVLLVACALACSGLRLPRPERGDGHGHGGMRQVVSDVPVVMLLLLSGMYYLALTLFQVLGVSFAASALGTDQAGEGLLVGAPAMGVLVGSLLGAGLARRRHLLLPFVLGIAGAGLLASTVSLAPSLAIAVMLMVFMGTSGGFGSLASEVLVNRAIEDEALLRVYAVWETVVLLGYVVGAWVAPVLVAVFGARAAYIPAGAGMVLAAILLRGRMAPLDRRAVFRADVLARLRGVRFLAGAAPTVVDRIARTATWVDVEPGEDVVREGDQGDAYYVVDSGAFDVLQSGAPIHAPLRPGDGFGEIALLWDRPRTATVSAIEAGRLLRVERREFLAAVTGDPDSRSVAHSVAAAHLARDGDDDEDDQPERVPGPSG